MKPRPPRERAEQLLKEIKKDYPSFNVLKTRGSDCLVITLPRKEVVKLVPAKHNKDLENLETIVGLAQRLATSIIRDTVSSIIDKISTGLTDRLIIELRDKLPNQINIIKETVESVTNQVKQDFKTDTVYYPVDHGAGLKLVGSKVDTESKKDSIQDILDKLAGLDLNRQK